MRDRRPARAPRTRARGRTRISQPYACLEADRPFPAEILAKLHDNLFRVALTGEAEEGTGDTGEEETSAADLTTAPTPSKMSSGSAVAGGVATIARHARRRVRRVAPRLRPA
jgi:hypothetical protein